MWGPQNNYPIKFFNICVKWVTECKNTKNLILINYKILKKKKKKNQSHTLNKNHCTTMITTRPILLQIRKKNDHK